MFIFGGRSDLTGGQWQVNMGPDYYSNKVKIDFNYTLIENIYTWLRFFGHLILNYHTNCEYSDVSTNISMIYL